MTFYNSTFTDEKLETPICRLSAFLPCQPTFVPFAFYKISDLSFVLTVSELGIMQLKSLTKTECF